MLIGLDLKEGGREKGQPSSSNVVCDNQKSPNAMGDWQVAPEHIGVVYFAGVAKISLGLIFSSWLLPIECKKIPPLDLNPLPSNGLSCLINQLAFLLVHASSFFRVLQKKKCVCTACIVYYMVN